jgi:hypothetical protein
VLTSCSGTSSCYVECYRGDKISDDIEKSGNEALDIDEIRLFRENAKDLCVSFHFIEEKEFCLQPPRRQLQQVDPRSCVHPRSAVGVS